MTLPPGWTLDPMAQFSRWYDEALSASAAAGAGNPADAMVLATATKDGKPSARVVLYKGMSGGGIRFFTNYESRKGRELIENPFASLAFFWPSLDRQVRFEGRVEKLDRRESEEYFHSRPRGSQIGAWASKQSSEIPGREVLDEQVEQLTAEHEGKEIPLPPFWGGFRLLPEVIEFWVGRPDRLHDRISYRHTPQGWTVVRLSP